MESHIDLFSKHSGMSPARIQLLDTAIRELKVPGAVVECGVMNGGSLVAMAWAAKKSGINREAWGFDSWEGCPMPGPEDIQMQHAHDAFEGMCKGTMERVEDLYRQCQMDRRKLHLIRGWVEKTLPENKSKVGPIAFLHVDVDFYEPTSCVLRELYPQVAIGGWVVCDDYNYWLGANRAVHEFIVDKNVTLERPSVNGVWWKKT